MNNNIFKINNLLYTGVFTLLVLSLPFSGFAQASPIAFTGSYAVINDNSAVKILGLGDTGGDINADVWFEWGTNSSSLNNRTSVQTIITYANVVAYLSNISQNTKYY